MSVCLHTHWRQLDIAIYVEPIVLAGQHHTAVVHERHIEALRVLHLRLERRDQLPILREDRQVEVVVVVRDEDLPVRVDPDANWVVGNTLAANLPQILALVVEHLDTVRPIVADEDLLLVVHHHAVGELEVLRAPELVQHIAVLIKDDHTHHLAFHHNDPSLVVHGHAARMLQNGGPEFPHKLAVLIVDLYLVCGRALGDNNIAGIAHHGHAVRIEQLRVTLAALAKLELEASLLVEDLNAMVVRIRNNDVILGIYRHTAGLRELALHHAEFAKLAVVNHLLSLDLRLGRIDSGRKQLVGEVQQRL